MRFPRPKRPLPLACWAATHSGKVWLKPSATKPFMLFQDVPIKRKLTSVIMLTSSIVLSLTCLAFVAYDLITFRRQMTGNLATLAQVVAANCTGAVAYIDEDEARKKLASLKS